MTEHLTSLELIHETFERERDRDLAHFEGLDTKAGVVLGFSGVLATLHGAGTSPSLIGVILAVGAATAGLLAFWPRNFPTVDAQVLREYLNAEERFTRLVMVDTYLELLAEGRDLLKSKARRLKWAMVLLATSALAFGI